MQTVKGAKTKPSAKRDILFYMESGGILTVKIAADLFGHRSLSSTISQLRRAGYQIESKPVDHITKYGKRGRHYRYFIKPENRLDNQADKV